jgi:hypothetical protein
MTDDIVTRLRKQFRNEFVIDHPRMVRVPTLYEEAADEIAKLRYQIHNYRNALCAIEYVVSEERRKLEEAADEWWEVVEDEQSAL